ncbi:hypothetical protein QQF64_034196 [Cirrhinus molitorella]|uniref:ribonuclease H n=1 Tax=Cirrhinus molitorella TaxID=172907 RepID=A0ABR3MW20_9TELE
MDSAGVPMPRMDWDSLDLPDAWRRFRQHAELMFKGPLHKKSEEEHCSYLLLWVGEKGRDIYNTWTLTEANAKLLNTYYDKFEAYIMPKKNHIFARYKFHKKVQTDGESFDNFVTELKLLVKDCGYTNADKMVRDRIVFTINSPKVKEKLLNYGPDLTLEKAIDIAWSHEVAQGQLKSMTGPPCTAHTPQVAHAVFKRGYGGEHLSVKGTCQLQCKHKETKPIQEFYVVDTQAPPILGLKACLEMDMIKLVLSVQTSVKQNEDLFSEFADVFEGIGQFPGECKIHLDPAATPVIYPPRKIPFTLHGRLKEELNRREHQGIIEKVTEPTDWVNVLVVVEKPRTGELRICLDPRNLNEAIKRPHYPLPTLDDVISRLSVSAQDEFQRKIDETYEGLSGVAAIVDDILVYGHTKEDHDKNLRAMLQRTRERGVRLNPEKSTICVPEVSYFGHRLTHDGIKPDQKKIKATKEMEPPQNKSELETILGMINYLSRFAPRLAEINASLRHMLKQGNEFTWDETHSAAFQEIKDLITK